MTSNIITNRILVASLFFLCPPGTFSFTFPVSFKHTLRKLETPSPATRSTGSSSRTSWKSNANTISALQSHDTSRIGFIKQTASTAIGILSLLTCNPSTSSGTTSDDVETKSNYVTFVNDKLLNSNDDPSLDNALKNINWNIPKKTDLNMEQMSDAINDGLIENEWFVTGKGRPEYFSNNFTFSDPQVSVVGYKSYCQGVRKLFDQETARCEVICCSVTGPNEITILWRNSGKIQLGKSLKLELLPYVVTTKLITDSINNNNGNLIISQSDEFDTDSLGLFLYQFSFLRPFIFDKVAPDVNTLKQKCDFRICKII